MSFLVCSIGSPEPPSEQKQFTDLLYPKTKQKMKKLTLLAAMFAIAMTGMSQDIIVTKKSNKIEAKILEISDDFVRFKRLDEINGASYTFSAEEVASIVFENGDVYVFPQSSNVKPPYKTERADFATEKLPEWGDTLYEEFPIRLKTGKELILRTGTPLDAHSGVAYYGDVRLKNKEYAELLSYCDEAYSIYQEAKRYENLSAVMSITSLASELLSFYFLFTDNPETGIYPLALGGVLLLIGVPIGLKSVDLKDQASAAFNKQCSNEIKQRYSAELSLSVSAHGLGLTLSF